MKLVEKASGNLVDVPDEHAAEAFQSGHYGVPKGQDIPVANSEGQIGTVAPEHLHELLQGGGRIASQEEFHTAAVEAKYGGVGGSLAATGEGLARGVSLGLSDPLAIGAGKLFGGKDGEAKVREHLAGEKEVHPWLSTGGELVGAAAPMILSGGASAPLGAIDEVGAMARIGEGVRTLGALPRGVQAAGDFAEHAVSGVLGAPGGTIGRAAQAAAKLATRGIVEGGLFGAGSEISEAALQDHELTGEKLMSGVGHAAMTAGLLGGALGGVGKLAGEGAAAVLGKLSPKLDEAVGERAWKWLGPRVAESREAAQRAGGTDAVGRTVFDRVLKPLVEEKGLSGAAISGEEKLALVRKAADETGKEVGDLIRGREGATAKLSEMLKPIQELESKMTGEVLGGDKARALGQLREDLTRILGADEALPPPAVNVPRTNEEIASYLRENPKVLEEMGNGPLPEHVRFSNVAEPVAARAIGEVEVPIADAIAQRRALQQRVFEEAKALDPGLRVKLLREVSGAWNDLEVKTLNEASAHVGGLDGDKLRQLNKEFQRLSIAEKTLENTTARYAANNHLSLSDNMWGAAHFTGAMAAGHPLAAMGAIGTSYAHKAVRAHGDAYAALMLDRLATWGGVSRAVAEHDQQVEHALDAVVSRTEPAKIGKARAFHVEPGNDRFERDRTRVEQLAQVAPALAAAHLQDRAAPVATHAPMVAQGMTATASRATAFLVSKLPPKPIHTGLQPQLQKQSYSEPQKATLTRAVDAVDGGLSGILERVASGKLTKEDVEASRLIWPKTRANVCTKLAAKCADRKTPLVYQQRLRIARFLGQPVEAPEFARAVQDAYARHAQRAQGGGGKSPTPPRLSLSKALMGPFESAQRGAS